MKNIPTFEDFIMESYKRVSSTTKIAGKYEVISPLTKNTKAICTVAGFERNDDSTDSLYLDDNDEYKKAFGSIIVQNKDMSKLEKGIEVIATISNDGTNAKIKRIGDL